jgi:hypothetical protein
MNQIIELTGNFFLLINSIECSQFQAAAALFDVDRKAKHVNTINLKHNVLQKVFKANRRLSCVHAMLLED